MRRRKKKWTAVLLATVLAVQGCSLLLVSFYKTKADDEAERNRFAYLQETDYSVGDEIAAARQKLEKNPQKPTVITDINTVDKKVAVCFEGSADSVVLKQIMRYLDEHDMEATFFISAVDAGEDQEIAREIADTGYGLESYTLYGTPHMEKMSQEELVEDFCRAQAVYGDKIFSRPKLLKCNATEYTDELMEAADASGYESIVYPTQYLNYQSFYREETAKDYVSELGKGRVVSIKLDGYLDETEFQEKETSKEPAKDKQAGVALHELEDEDLSESGRLLNVVDWFLTQLDEQGYETVSLEELPAQDMGDIALYYKEMEEQYEDEMVQPVASVHTTDREMAFTFRGLGNAAELTNVLLALQEADAKATFFVTGQEIEAYPQQVRQIIEAGHEVGSGGYAGKSMEGMEFGEICEDIYKNDMRLESIGIHTDLFMAPYDTVTQEVQMAAQALGKQIISVGSSPTRKDYAEQKYSAEDIIRKYYGRSKEVFCRGEIVHFNMNVYDDTDSVAALVEAAWRLKVLPTRYGTREGNILQVTTVSNLLDNTWHYPAVTNASYHMVGASGKMQDSWEHMLLEGYIGGEDVRTPGFAQSELLLLDRTGRIDTGGSNTVFLTFDDWGNEATTGKILYVLRKHKIKATFFILTEYVVNGTSENLLRAIAEEGHDVASHTHTHMSMEIGPDQIQALRQDLVESHRVLANVAGDTGRVTDFLRAPTLALNKDGVMTGFDCGYGYIISGDFDPADYKAAGVDSLYDALLNGVLLDDGERMTMQDGSIVVMHINTHSVHTAQALDRYLNYVEGLPEGEPGKFRFAKLSDYLQ